MKTRLSALTRQGRQHLLMLALVFAGGLGLLAWGWPVDGEGLQALRDEVGRLHAELQALQRWHPSGPDAAGSTSQGAPAPDEPALAEAERVWPWLQARIQAHGLQVQALRPQAVTTAHGLPEQAFTLQLQGRWHDWLALQAALNAHAPWWLVDQWQVAPVAGTPDSVRIELQARLGLRPPALPGAQAPRVWPSWSVAAALPTAAGGGLLAQPQRPAAATPVREPAGVLPAGPQGWPMDQLRLLGVWRQAGRSYAVVGAGPHRVVLGVGQGIGHEGYRVSRIGDDHVELRAGDQRGPVLRLVVQEGKP